MTVFPFSQESRVTPVKPYGYLVHESLALLERPAPQKPPPRAPAQLRAPAPVRATRAAATLSPSCFRPPQHQSPFGNSTTYCNALCFLL